MQPTLENGDIVLVNRLVYNARMPRRGDVIAFQPGGNEHIHESIKRIVGVPGEVIQIKDGSIYINGEQQQEDIYISELGYAGIAEEPLTLQENEFFVIGDNPSSSNDSRMMDVGVVERRYIKGQVWFIASGSEAREIDFGERIGL